jgi:hypothetical protein
METLCLLIVAMVSARTVMRQLVGCGAPHKGAASASAMGRFETEMLKRPENLTVLADLLLHAFCRQCRAALSASLLTFAAKPNWEESLQ